MEGRKIFYSDKDIDVASSEISGPISRIFDYFGSTPTDAVRKIGLPEEIIEGEWEKTPYDNYVKYIEYRYPDISVYYIAVNDSSYEPKANYFDRIFLESIEFRNPAYSVLGIKVGDKGKKYVIKKLKHYDLMLGNDGNTPQNILIFYEKESTYSLAIELNGQEVVTKIWASTNIE